MIGRRFFMAGVCLFYVSTATARLIPDPHYCQSAEQCQNYNVAHFFMSWRELKPKQQELLKGFGIVEEIGGVRYQDWVMQHDDEAAAFLAITQALSRMEITLADGRSLWALSMVLKVSRFAGDRLHAVLDSKIFESWKENDGAFRIFKANGEIEADKINFHSHSMPSGSLHEDYDIQGYTSSSKMPRIQFNYRIKDSEADIDIDRHKPLLGGLLPNPAHLTYENSDPRQWLEKFIEKFGIPGFQVRAAPIPLLDY